MSKKWFEFKALSADEAEISIYDAIGGWGIRAQDFKNEFDKLKNHKKINIRIHSRGGSVMDAAAIATMIEQHTGEITGIVEGLAASCAAQLVQSVKKRKMAKDGYMMIHKPWASIDGNADEFRNHAEFLDKIQKNFVNKLVSRGKLPEADVNALLNKTTWMTAEEALANGFIDELLPEMKVAAFAGHCEFKDIPEGAKKFFPEQFGLSTQNNVDDDKNKPKGKETMSKELLSRMKELFGAEFATEAYAADMKLEDAAIKFVGNLKTEIVGLKQSEANAKAALETANGKIKTLETDVLAKDAQIKGLKEGTIPLGANGEGGGDEGKETFEGKVKEIMASMKITKAKAIPMVVKQFPKLHAAYIERTNKK